MSGLFLCVGIPLQSPEIEALYMVGISNLGPRSGYWDFRHLHDFAREQRALLI